MSTDELDPETYREIWGEYPPERDAYQIMPRGALAPEPVAEAVTEARLVREALLAALEPHLVGLQTRLSAIESRLEGLERELKEVGNRGMRGGYGGGYGTK